MRTIEVIADWKDLNGSQKFGVLNAQVLRGKEVFSFEYDDAWLKNFAKFQLDPELQFYKGTQYLNEDRKTNFGLFLDSSPDRWGRVLMRRREAALARKEKRAAKTLLELDYLLGVYDPHRMGAIRFKEAGVYLNDNKEMASPPWISLTELVRVSLLLEEENAFEDKNYLKWLNMLVAPGSSLGGARPKAGLVDKRNNLWIAKFPSKNDDTDIGVWEMLVHILAIEVGIKMADSQVRKYANKRHTFITKRFDRTNSGERIHFASAMTLLGKVDGDNSTDGVSYLDIVDFISKGGGNVTEDLEELWRRIVFSICVSNTDDHLRNHGFILTLKGWVLSPAFDINPVPTATGLKLNINENENSLDLSLALEVKAYFRISDLKANEIINHTLKIVGNWKKVANSLKISKSEQELMSNAFRIANNS